MNGYEAFVITPESRQALKVLMPPIFPTWIGHHITHKFPATRTPNVPYGEQTTGNFDIVGYAKDTGIEAFVVAVHGSTLRPDGGTYHLTWSLDRDQGRKPFDSNALIKNHGFIEIAPIRLEAVLDFISHQ